MRSGQQALDVPVVRVQDHEDRRNLLVHPLQHGQRHALVQVVPAEGHDVEVCLRLFLLLLTFFDHGHVTLVVEEDDFELVAAG